MLKRLLNFWQELLQELKFRLTPMHPSSNYVRMSEKWLTNKELHNGD